MIFTNKKWIFKIKQTMSAISEANFELNFPSRIKKYARQKDSQLIKNPKILKQLILMFSTNCYFFCSVDY